MTKRIIQFGTSRFLQAHADLFVHEAREAGQDIGPITIVKTTRGEERIGGVKAFTNHDGFPVIIRGMLGNELLNKTYTVRSIDRALIADRDWAELKRSFAHEVDIIFSNVSEAGYEVSAQDIKYDRTLDHAPISFPAKLLSLLKSRFEASGKKILILPCELISDNGKVLRSILNDLAKSWRLSSGFFQWLEEEVVICDTLVDRIVSEAIEPIGAIGEPYALWVIKRDERYPIPFSHPSVILTDDLTPFLRLKLHILNLGHSFLAEIWYGEHRASIETVGQMLSDPTIKKRLLSLYENEVIRGFEIRSMRHEAESYVEKTIERFQNPFLNHRLSDIFQNQTIKVERRVVAFINWVHEIDALAKFPELENLAKQHGFMA